MTAYKTSYFCQEIYGDPQICDLSVEMLSIEEEIRCQAVSDVIAATTDPSPITERAAEIGDQALQTLVNPPSSRWTSIITPERRCPACPLNHSCERPQL